jgi:carbon-monoxide dehydrogenase medium subunit
MKSAPFGYHRPATGAEALALKADLGADARVLAGGQSLIPLMHFRLVSPGHLIDINALDEWDYVRRENGSLLIGARARQADVLASPEADASAPLLTQALGQVGHAQVRHRGTVVGTIAHADPSAEIPAVLVALGGTVTARSASRTRRITAADLLTGPFMTSLADDEIITEVQVPGWPESTGSAFLEFTRIYHGFPVVGVAALISLRDDGVVDRAVVGLCGMAANAITVPVDGLIGAPPTADVIDAVARSAVAALEPPADVHGSTAYRKRVGTAYIRRALTAAATAAAAATPGGPR